MSAQPTPTTCPPAVSLTSTLTVGGSSPRDLTRETREDGDLGNANGSRWYSFQAMVRFSSGDSARTLDIGRFPPRNDCRVNEGRTRRNPVTLHFSSFGFTTSSQRPPLPATDETGESVDAASLLLLSTAVSRHSAPPSACSAPLGPTTNTLLTPTAIRRGSPGSPARRRSTECRWTTTESIVPHKGAKESIKTTFGGSEQYPMCFT
eukprot:m.29648 g.29648  ORF g.29648 m.29648 type:complete len:206 (-) comp6722_c0_seq1:3651-4268(-)